MGNTLTFNDAYKYRIAEAVPFGVATGSLLLVIGLVIVLWSVINKCPCCSYRNYACRTEQRALHSILTLIFPGLFGKQVRMVKPRKNNSLNFVAIVMEDDQQEKYEKVYLIGDKEFDKSKKGACCYTYTYFILTGIVLLFWFIVTTVEHAIYIKTGTCNDLNFEDNSYRCFEVMEDGNLGDKIKIDCQVYLNLTVFCYKYHANPGALGIAYGFMNLLAFGITIYFRVTSKAAEIKKCRVLVRALVIIIQVTLSLLTIVVFIALPSVNYEGTGIHNIFKSHVYFFRGNAAMRWVIYLLIPLTAAVVIPVPWCCFTGEKKQNVILDESYQPTASQQAGQEIAMDNRPLIVSKVSKV